MFENLEIVFRVLIGGVLLAAGVAKWRLGPHQLAIAIRGYRLLPPSVPDVAARAIISAEVVAGVALIAGVAVEITAVVAIVLLLIFASAMAASLARGLASECGCGLVAQQRVSWLLVYRNLALSVGLVPATGSAGVAILLVIASLGLGLVHLATAYRASSIMPNSVGGNTP